MNELPELPNGKIYLDTPDRNEAYSDEYARYDLAELLDLGADLIIDQELLSKVSKIPELKQIDLAEQYKNIEMADCIVFYTIDWLSARQVDLLQKVASMDKEVFVREFLNTN